MVPRIAAGVFLVLGIFAAHQRANSVALYAALVIRFWLGVLLSGIHATLAGILVALAVSIRSRIRPKPLITIAVSDWRDWRRAASPVKLSPSLNLRSNGRPGTVVARYRVALFRPGLTSNAAVIWSQPT
jgi:hypothetical protein